MSSLIFHPSAIMYFFIFILFIFTASIAEVRGQVGRCPRPEAIAPCQCRTRGPTIQVRCTNSLMGRITEAMDMLRQSVTEVDVLILEDNNIPHLPSRAFGSVKINRLFIENNRMVTIDRNAFAGVEDFLTELYIKESNLKSLPKDAVDFLYELRVFSIENSQIMTMPKVTGLQKLKLFKIDGSKIREIPSRSLSDLPSLTYLHICRSGLSRLDVGVLENLRYLVLANFTDNQISSIHPRAFRYMELMEEVVLKGNKFKDARQIGRAMRVVKPLKKLDLSHNEIEDLLQDSFVDIINLEELDLSHNLLTDLKRKAVYRMPRLRSVKLSNNRIQNFHSDSFDSTPLIDELRLNHNRLTDVSDVSFVMDALPRLRLLDLSNNDIRDIPFGALRGYPALERLFLASNQISRVSLQALADMPSLKELDLSDNKLITDAIDGPIFDLPNLKILNLSKNKLSLLDNRLLNSLNRLQRLDVSHNGISSVSESAFHGVGRLDYLNISHNNLRELKPKTFKGLTQLFELDASDNQLVALSDYLLSEQRKLEYVSFAYNQLQLISKDLFPSINRIRFLDFTSNFIMAFPEKLITGLPHLEKLLFRRNSLQKLSRRSFTDLYKLEVLDLHDNRIQDIEEGAFEDLTNLKGLDLSLNIISTVGDTLEPLANLMKLNLSDNYITSLPRNAFHSLEKLSTLDVSNNTIVEVGTAFTSMPQLKYLDLSYNHLPTIKKGTFKDLPALVGLRLDYNSIIELQAEAFQDLWNLETLILTKNGIPKIKSDTFRNLPSLEKLKLDDNLIERLERRSFADLFALKELHLEQNIIKTIEEGTFIRVSSVRYLNMSYNLLQDLPRSGFYGLDTLETLDLSFNDLRSVDSSLFNNMKWLVDLKLNDNNICRINRYAFRETSSLRSLSLKNNRLTTLPQDAFYDVQKQIAKFDVAGNPITCDCETLWLRNWVSDDQSAVQDEPICYFPQQLSGNPLKKLRTSRFTCGTGRSSDLIQDACQGVPVKTPVQQSLSVGLDSGIFNTPDLMTYETEHVSKPEEEPIDLANKSSEDVDVIDIDSQNDNQNANYEYYYVYYDEDGNVVDKSPPKAVTSSSTTTSTNKAQEIPLVSTSVNSLLDSEETGDTPTIYAGLSKNSTDTSLDKEEEAKDDEGLSIFGIPIPKIPFPILSFGLAPTTLSHGLLPIGRKGDPSADSESEIETNNRRKTSTTQEITRGPDNVDPIWLETLINGAKYLINNNNGDDKEKSKISEDTLSVEDRVYNQFVEKFNEKVKNNNKNDYYPGEKNKYLQPQNPVIPISAATEIQQRRTPIPYYPPPKNVPAIKFDHPVQINGLQYPQPISPAPGLQPNSYPTGPHNNYPAGPPTSEDGFIPLFMPDKSDPVLTQRIEKLPPEGYTLPNYGHTGPSLNFDHIPEYPLVYPKPPQQLPAQEIPIVYANSYENQDNTRQLPITTVSTTPKTVLDEVKDILDLSNDYYYTYEDFPKYESVPSTAEVVVQSDQYGFHDLAKASTSTTEKTISTTQRKIPTLKVQEILPAMGSFREPGAPVMKPDLIASTTTELTPAKEEEEEEIQMSEEITTKEPLQNLPSDNSSSSASGGDNVVYEYEYYYEYYDDPNAVKTENNNSVVINTIETSKADEDVSSSEATVPSSSGFSLQNILNLITKTVPAATEVSASETTKRKDQNGVGDSKEEFYEDFTKKPSLILPFIEQPQVKDNQQVRIPKEKSDFRARSTKQPPTSTQNLVNYLENRRSTVSVDSSTPIDNHRSRVASGRSTTSSVLGGGQSSTPSYPFYPDRLDPKSKVHNGNNEVKWYYSNYHTENVEPYVDPRFPRENSEAAKVHSSASSSSISINVTMFFCILFAHYFY